MLERGYSREQRRALNVIWNASGRYDWQPLFMAFEPNGESDFYFNTIVGLCTKFLGEERIAALFAGTERASRHEEFDDLLWLGLENYAFGREKDSRTVLAQLRSAHAARFFRDQQDLSRQQQMLQSSVCYDMQAWRWSKVLGKRQPLLSAKGRRMAAALELDAALDGDAVIAALNDFLKTFFHYDAPAHRGERAMAPTDLLRQLLRRERSNVDRLVVRVGVCRERDWRLRHEAHMPFERHSSAVAEQDRAYIETMFGCCSWSETALRALENKLCVDEDQYCRLWITASAPAAEAVHSPLLNVHDRAALHDAHEQAVRNRAYIQSHGVSYASSVRSLSAQLDRIFSSFAVPLPENGKVGALRTDVAYRLPILRDANVFLRPGDERDPQVSVTLLLDASSSRMNTQEIIAAQSCILSEALEKNHIPVQVLSFRSLRGYTVLQQLKGYTERGRSHITDYYTGGWNRDSLALRAAAELMEKNDPAATVGSGNHRVLLVLTDAGPNDSTRIPPRGKDIFAHEYEGEAAAEATANAVKELRRQGLFVGAIYYGSNTNLESLHRFYGQQAVRIRSLEQIANAASYLLELMLRQLDGKA